VNQNLGGKEKMKTQLNAAAGSAAEPRSWDRAEAWAAGQEVEALSMLQPAAARPEPVHAPSEDILRRATAMTSVMSRILQQASAPSHWGINE
jgi:hypothetical protein